MRKLQPKEYIFLFCIIFIAGLTIGWVVTRELFSKTGENEYLRLRGYKFISPLLVCDTSAEKKAASLDGLESKINDLLTNAKLENKITTASVYFRDLSNGQQININPDEKYYPASLNKVPLMIAILKLAETKPELLNQQVKAENFPETNHLQEIQPKKYAKKGETYTVLQLIEMMIQSSDNNSFFVLSTYLDRKSFDETFKTFNISYPDDQSNMPDYLTAYDFTYFLRVLYNATYLKRDLSENALSIMSNVDFNEGLVAGVPKGTQVAHKFGLKNDIDANNKTVAREIHDCGIIYAGENTYSLCIMTKSTAEIPAIEETFKAISTNVYDFVNNS